MYFLQQYRIKNKVKPYFIDHTLRYRAKKTASNIL